MWVSVVTALIAATAALLGVLAGLRGERRRWRRDAKFQAHCDLLAMVHQYVQGQPPPFAEVQAILARDELVTDDIKIPIGTIDMLMHHDRGENITSMQSALVARCRQDLGLKYIFKNRRRSPVPERASHEVEVS